MIATKQYGEQTSKDSKKLIIDVFNNLNKDAPYVMKTITTIYINDEVFRDNNRYPIDAPYKPYYPELTKYVSDHRLDDIFFVDGVPKVGEYYFEYCYNHSTNTFFVFSSPNLETKVIQDYIPMLYSMVTDNEIPWSKAQVFFGSPDSNNSLHCVTYNILLVFGKGTTLKTLEFSWLTTFELDSLVIKDLEGIIKKIRSQEKEIICIIQGVLFSNLEDVIIKYIQAEKQLDVVRNLIKDHKHTIKNFGFSGHFGNLKTLINSGDYITAIKSLSYVDNLSLLIDCTTDKLYNFGNKDKILLKEKGKTTYTEILNFIHSATEDASLKVIFFDPSIENHVLNKIDDSDLYDVFTVLLNMYSNCRNFGKEKHSITLKIIEQNLLEISFINKGRMEKSFVDYFLGRITNTLNDIEGLKYITVSLNYLKHIKRKHKEIDDDNILQLIITLKDGQQI